MSATFFLVPIQPSPQLDTSIPASTISSNESLFENAARDIGAIQKMSLVVVSVVGSMMIAGLFICFFYVRFRRHIHRFWRKFRTQLRPSRPSLAGAQHTSDLYDLEKAIRKLLVHENFHPGLANQQLSLSCNIPSRCLLSTNERGLNYSLSSFQPDNSVLDPVQHMGSGDGYRSSAPFQLPPFIQSSPLYSTSAAYGQQASKTDALPSTIPTTPILTIDVVPPEDNRLPLNEHIIRLSSAPQLHEQISTAPFDSPSIYSTSSSLLDSEPSASPPSVRLSRASILSSAYVDGGSPLLVPRKPGRILTPETPNSCPPNDAASSHSAKENKDTSTSGSRWSDSTQFSEFCSKEFQDSNTTYPALSALMSLVVEDVTGKLEPNDCSPQPISPLPNLHSETITTLESDVFVEISLDDVPVSDHRTPACEDETDTACTSSIAAKKSGRKRCPESRLMSQLIDELTGRWRTYEEFVGALQGDTPEEVDLTPQTTPDSGTPVTPTFGSPSTPTDWSFCPRKGPFVPIGRHPTFIGMDWDNSQATRQIKLPQQPPAARLTLPPRLSLIQEGESLDSASVYSQDDIDHLVLTSSPVREEKLSSNLRKGSGVFLQFDPPSSPPSRHRIRPLILNPKYPKPRPLTLDVSGHACSGSVLPRDGRSLSLVDTDSETRKAMGIAVPPPSPVLPKELEAIYPTSLTCTGSQTVVENGSDEGFSWRLASRLGRLIGLRKGSGDEGLQGSIRESNSVSRQMSPK